MTPEEIKAMAEGLAQGQAVWYVLSACIGGLITGAGAYVAEKGKNRATKEDIAAITTKVKEVEDVFNRGLSDLNAHHQLRMVAAERRLEAHQQAFQIWRQLYIATATKEKEDVMAQAAECRKWYDANCVFLTANSRSAFNHACVAAQVHVMQADKPGGGLLQGDLYMKNWDRLEGAGNVFLADVSLPEMSLAELKQEAASTNA